MLFKVISYVALCSDRLLVNLPYHVYNIVVNGFDFFRNAVSHCASKFIKILVLFCGNLILSDDNKSSF